MGKIGRARPWGLQGTEALEENRVRGNGAYNGIEDSRGIQGAGPWGKPGTLGPAARRAPRTLEGRHPMPLRCSPVALTSTSNLRINLL